jgi:four helix bundle protein
MDRAATFAPRPFDAERLDAYRVARALLAEVAPFARRWPRGHADLGDQLVRATTSVLLNLGEGAAQPPGSGAKRRHYAIARASAGEVAAALDAARILGLGDAGQARARAARVSAMLTALCRG